MCLLLCAWRAHPDLGLIVAANRDEYHQRPTAPAAWWPPDEQIAGGRDLQGGGSWLALHRAGRFAALTNVRGSPVPAGAPSRGGLVAGFLQGGLSCEDYAQQVLAACTEYAGFNLLLGDLGLAGHPAGLHHLSNMPMPRHEVLPPGMYAMSNGALDEPWPKLQRAKARFMEIVRHPGPPLPAHLRLDALGLVSLLRDDAVAPDHQLPTTGVPLHWERLLSAIFVKGPTYGTRCTTIAALGKSGGGVMCELSYDPQGQGNDQVSLGWRLESLCPEVHCHGPWREAST
jgi:uncharacterized protein with NRDE domain